MTHATITVRRPTFTFSGTEPAWFCGNLVLSVFVNLISATATVFEPAAIQVVRAHRGALTDPVLQADAAAFVAQEAQHCKQHLAMNRWLAGLGYPMGDLTGAFRGAFEDIRQRKSDLEMLAVIASLEHITAVFSTFLLRYAPLTARTDDASAMIRWHCREELEHKSVCFDVYAACGGDLPLRRRTMFWVAVGFTMTSARSIRLQLRGRRVPLGQRLHAAWFLVALWGSLIWHTIQYMRPGFHPTDMDSHLSAGL